MSIEAGFVAAIADAPDDDTHRLIFADWLDDNGQAERAEFIRLQIQLARAAAPVARSLRERARALLEAHEEEWAAPLLDFVDKVAFHRGFVERVTLTVADLLESGEALFARAPVREVVLVRAGPGLDELAACPHLARLVSLDFREGTFPESAVPVLFASPHLARLERFVLRLHEIGDAVLETLAETGRPAALKTLDLYETNVSADGIAALASSPVAASLERLILGGSHELPEGAIVPLAESPHFGRLQTMHLGFTRLGDADARALAAAAHLGNLRSLDLRDSAITAAGAEVLLARFGSIVHLGRTIE